MSDQTTEHSKDKNYWTLLNNAIELDIKKGHLKWTLSDLSRKSDITRSLIYYYFGKDKQIILKEAIKLIGEKFIGLTEERYKMWEEGRLAESLMEARSFYEKAPYLPIFILINRPKENMIGESMRGLEKDFQNKLKLFYPNSKEYQITSIFAIYWGIVFSPKICKDSVDAVTKLISSSFK